MFARRSLSATFVGSALGLAASLSASDLQTQPIARWAGVPLEEISSSQTRSANVPKGRLLLITRGAEALLQARQRGDSPRAFLAKRGLQWIGSIGRDGALVRVLADGAEIPESVSVVELTPELKLAEGIQTVTRSIPPEEEIALVVHLAESNDALRAALAAMLPPEASLAEWSARDSSARAGIRLPAASAARVAEALAKMPSVYLIERGSGAKLLNRNGRRAIQSGTTAVGGETVWQKGLLGANQIIAILDTGADPRNCYLAEADVSFPPVNIGLATAAIDTARRKIISYCMLWSSDNPANGISAYDSQGHGTAVAGNAAASELTATTGTTTFNGPAPLAKIVVQDGGYQVNACADMPAIGCPVIDITDILEQAYTLGARIHNNSWGDQEDAMPQNNYTSACVDVDDMTWRRPDFLVVCAAGNSGSGNNTVGSPSVAKNALSVAGTESPSIGNVVSFSSRGWAQDGRIKPEICAPAQTTSSRRNNGAGALHCDTGFIQGTSMASPMAAGAAALVREYYTAGWYPSGTANGADAIAAPSAALLKATLFAGAAAMTSESLPPPSRGQGWGRIHLDDSLHFAGEPRKLIVHDLSSHFSSGADAPFEVEIEVANDPAAGPLKIVLVWSDYPALAGANPTLVNDLNLTVTDPGNASYRGNVFNASGDSTTGGSADAVNNVEVTKFATPAAGFWRITVSPETIIQPGQGFALVIAGPAQAVTNSSVGEQWRVN